MLEIRQIYKTYEEKPLLEGVSFQILPGETVCLLGSSGSGKTTLLKIIAGLESAESGDIFWDGVSLAPVPVHQRHFSLMFQDYALFPHMNVGENIAFGLKQAKMDPATIQKRVSTLLEQMNLSGFAGRRVTDLSGGEQQRVALARALAPSPRLLMLDEPLGALDRALREQLMGELRHLLHQSGLPAVYVTHDQREAFSIADRIILLHEGHIMQEGTPQAVYNDPANAWVAQFLGLTNLLDGEVVNIRPLQVKIGHSILDLPETQKEWPGGEKVQVLIRPDGVERAAEPHAEACFRAKVNDMVFLGELYQCELEIVETGAILSIPLKSSVAIGETILMRFIAKGIRVYAC